MNAECRKYFDNMNPLPLEKVIAERAHMYIIDGHYQPFFRTPHGTEMVLVWSAAGLCLFPRQIISGLFSVGKSGKEAGSKRSHRFTLEVRPGKANEERDPNPQIPDRESLGEIFLSKEEECKLGTTDLSVYFYYLKIPEVLEGLKGLPPLFIDPSAPLGGNSGLLLSVLCVAAMGGRHFSTISQAVHLQLWNVPSPIAYHPGHIGRIDDAPWANVEFG